MINLKIPGLSRLPDVASVRFEKHKHGVLTSKALVALPVNGQGTGAMMSGAEAASHASDVPATSAAKSEATGAERATTKAACLSDLIFGFGSGCKISWLCR